MLGQSKSLVLNMGSIEPFRFGGLISGIRQSHLKIYVFLEFEKNNILFFTEGFGTTNKVKNHWS